MLPAVLLAVGAASAAESSPQDFAYAQRIVVTETAAGYRLALPIEVYQRAVRADLGDLRVFNARGEVVPYALRRPRLDAVRKFPAERLPLFPITSLSPASLDAVRVTIESGRGALNVEAHGAGKDAPGNVSYILDTRAVTRPLAAFTLDWPADAAEFAGRLRVEVSDDLSAWQLILPGAAIANLGTHGDRLIERRIEFSPLKAKYWRLTWVDGQAPFQLTGVAGEPTDDLIEIARKTLTVAALTSDTQPGEFRFDAGARIPVDRVGLELPESNSVVQAEIFSREQAAAPWQPVAQRGFYRLTGAGGELTSGWVAIGDDNDRYWRVKIDVDRGGLGKRAPKLTLGWIPHELVFIARGDGPFQLVYGNAGALPAQAAVESILPALATAGGGASRVTIAMASLGPQQALGGESRLSQPPAAYPWKTTLLWVVLGLGVVILAFMALRLARDTRKE
ncbi:MAG TPA: DUF3999 domain-containing protein [Steroidobacteraceae bacterium]|nr:DUF3999 domain-containing protein [Steroidobacteraceae bacterium]